MAILNKILIEKKITKYRLSKDSGIAKSTIMDLCNGKTDIKKCSVETLYKLAKTLDIPMEKLYELEIVVEQRTTFEVFKSNICHYVKDNGDVKFITKVLESNEIRKYYDKKWYLESFYLLGMLDYLSNDNNVPLCIDYNDIRRQKLATPLYPQSVLIKSEIMKSDKPKMDCLKNAIPEFLKFNIIENEVRNVF